MKKMRRVNMFLLVIFLGLVWGLFISRLGLKKIAYNKNLKMGEKCYDSGLYEKSNYYYEKILETNKEDRIYLSLAKNYLELEDYYRAEDLSLEANFKKRKEIADGLVDYYLAEEDYESLRSYLKKMKKVDQDLYSHYLIDLKGLYQLKNYSFEQVVLNKLNDRFFLVKRQEGWGILDENNNMVVKPIYQWIGDFESLDRIPVKKDGNLDYINKEGHRQVEVKGGDFLLGIFADDSYILNSKKEVGLYNFLGEKIDGPHGRMEKLSSEELLVGDKKPVIVNKKTGKTEKLEYALVDREKILYKKLILLEDGEELVYNIKEKNYSKRYDQVDLARYSAVNQRGKWGYIDENFNEVIQVGYEDARASQGNLMPVKVKDKWGFIDLSNKLVVEEIFEDASELNRKNMGFVKIEGGWDKIEFILGDMIDG